MLKDLILKLAKDSVEKYINKEPLDGIITADVESDPFLSSKKACFVCLKIEGNLRGCIGTLTPNCQTLVEEIIRNAISAATCDYRFSPVTNQELQSIKYSVDVLSELEEATEEQLDPKKYGVLVKKNSKTGVLLPDLDGVDTVADQLNIAKQKAGIFENEEVKLFRFTVERYE